MPGFLGEGGYHILFVQKALFYVLYTKECEQLSLSLEGIENTWKNVSMNFEEG
jgi:hypothetical protein